MALPVPSRESFALRCITIDVEEYFQIEAAHGRVSVEQWTDWPGRVDRCVELLLLMLDRHNRQGTFFFLGWIARRYPGLVRQVAAAGHEIASHGSMHQRLRRLDPVSFRQDLSDSKKALEDQVGRAVVGYRAPTFSLVPQTAWAIDVLLELGFVYDASIFPVVHPQYGVPKAPDRPFYVRAAPAEVTGAAAAAAGAGAGEPRAILELPPLTWRVAGRKVAVAGGGYFRLLPLWFMQRGLIQAAKQDRPAVLYFHPWEFDPHMPRLPLPLLQKLRTYRGLHGTAGKFRQIISQSGRWVRMIDLVQEVEQEARGREMFVL